MNAFFDSLSRLFAQGLRGSRAVNLGAFLFLLVLALGVYAFKADAGKEGVRIREVDQKIIEETKAVRLLRAEIAHLEQPERLERLSIAYLNLHPQDAKRESPIEGLSEIAHRVEPAHPAAAAAVPAPSAPVAAPVQEPVR